MLVSSLIKKQICTQNVHVLHVTPIHSKYEWRSVEDLLQQASEFVFLYVVREVCCLPNIQGGEGEGNDKKRRKERKKEKKVNQIFIK